MFKQTGNINPTSEFFIISLYVSLAIFIIGLIYKKYKWFTVNIGPESSHYGLKRRIISSIKGFFKTIFSVRIFFVFKVILLDLILQIRILKNGFYSWLMHMLIFYGFIFLFFMHALDEPISMNLFSEYQATNNPFMLLRNIFGLMIIIGVLLAVFRKFIYKRPKLESRFFDKYAMIILAVIIISGVLLEGEKIMSEPVFNRMVIEMGMESDSDEIKPLKVYWSKEYKVVFKNIKPPYDKDILEEGKELHDMCKDCHVRPVSAFLAYPVAKKIMAPMSNILNKSHADVWLWYIHFLACFLMLAYLPFSKFIHIITNPVNLIIGGVVDKENIDPANLQTIRAIGIDSCIQCGWCSRNCSVVSIFEVLNNDNILPSNKITSITDISKDENLSSIYEGAMICTKCNKCTDACPAGINLQDLWIASTDAFREKGYDYPQLLFKKYNPVSWAEALNKIDEDTVEFDSELDNTISFTYDKNQFNHCVQCQTCTNVCPVVAGNNSQNGILYSTPQNVMNLLRLGLDDIAMTSLMVWDCATCYQCQEHCPQGIEVTDILYDLKNKAYERLRKVSKDELSEIISTQPLNKES